MPSDPYLTNGIVETITPAKAGLVGSVTIGPLDQPLSGAISPALLAARRTLKLIRSFGVLSSQLRSAILKKTILANVEIHAPNGKVTLTNAQIVKGERYLGNRTIGGGADSDLLEDYSFVFSKLLVENLATSRSKSDDVTGNSK